MHPDRTLGQPPPNRFATAAWFLRRPSTYRHFAELIGRSLTPSARLREDTQREAIEWGGPRAISPQNALDVVLGRGPTPSVETVHPEAMDYARRQAETSGFVLGGAANLELLFYLTRGLQAERVIETGVAYGWSSLAILLAQQELKTGHLVSTDMPYPRAGSEGAVGCVVPDPLRENWTLLRKPDRPALPTALTHFGGAVDLVHYDSDKSYAGQHWAFAQIWDALRPGGVLVADDIDSQCAFRDFTAGVGVDPLVVVGERKLIGIVTKP